MAQALTVGTALVTAAVWAQSDNFDSGTASGWLHSDVLTGYGGQNTYSFPTGPFGKGFRIQGTSSALLAGACGACGTARAYVYQTNVYSDFYVSADLVNWDNTLDQALVLGARIVGQDVVADPCPLPGPCNPGFGTTSGYVCNYDCNQDGATPGDRLGGEFQINRIDGESPNTLAAAEVTLIPGKAYRLVFQGVGTLLTGQIYDLEDLSTPVVTIQAQDSTYTSGVSGLISFSRDATTTDVTFDNYLATVADPNTDIAPAIRHSVPGTPQVVTRTPAKRFTGLYPAANGLSFSVNTFSTNQINSAATKLYLNGTDLSASLVPAPGSGTNIVYTLPGAKVSANTIYSGRIEVQNSTGTVSSTNTFWFDTFANSYLTTSPVKTIEVEDYNYSNGVFQLDPIAISGLDTNGAQVNLGLGGYFIMDGTPEVDYHDTRTSPESGWNDYRPDDYVGTIQGNREDIQDLNHPSPTTPPTSDPTRPDDGPRGQYAAVGMKEYEVARTAAGEWLNYTRVFADTNYNVFLRCGSFGTQDVSLSLVGGDPTTTNQTTSTLGTFSVQNHLMRLNYRYEPLVTNGAPAVLHLAGTNTLRLTLGGKPTKDDRLLMLNYLLFVPTSAVQPISNPLISFSNGGSGLVLSWPDNGFLLKTATDLGSPIWTTVTTGITLSGGTNFYTVPTTGKAGFYRLSSP